MPKALSVVLGVSGSPGETLWYEIERRKFLICCAVDWHIFAVKQSPQMHN
jgi:hypothetical protein